MRLLISICFAAATLFASAPRALAQEASAQTPNAAQLALAREYVTLGGSEDLFVQGATYGFVEAARAGGVTFTPAQRDQVEAVIAQYARPASEAYIAHLAQFFASNNTADDMAAALAFYRTTGGAHYVGATLQWTFPLTVYLSTQGRAPLAPVEPAPSTDRLEHARALAGRVIDQMHEADRVALDGSPIGLAGIREYIARSFAASLSDEDMDGAIAWTNTEAARRLEGPSAERTLAVQTATTLAYRAIDVAALRAEVLNIMNRREQPS